MHTRTVAKNHIAYKLIKLNLLTVNPMRRSSVSSFSFQALGFFPETNIKLQIGLSQIGYKQTPISLLVGIVLQFPPDK